MIRGREVHWLAFEDNQREITHQSNYLETLKMHLDKLLLTYQWAAPAAYGMTLQESLTIGIVLPGDSFLVSPQEKNEMITWVLSDPSRCTSLQLDHAANLLLGHFNQSENALPTILFDAFDGDTLISTNFENDFSNELPRLIPTLGKNKGIKKIFNVFLKDFERKNWELNKQQKENLEQQIIDFKIHKTLKINVIDANSESNTRLKLSESRYFDLLTSERNIIKNIFFSYKRFGIFEINLIFVSDFFDNGIFRDFVQYFFKEELRKKVRLNFISDDAHLNLLLRLMFKKSKSTPIKVPLLEKTKLRKSFFLDIKKKCTDRKKYSDYTAKFLPKGRVIDISDDVVIWHIRNALYNPQSLENIGKIIQKKQVFTQAPKAFIIPRSEQNVLQPPIVAVQRKPILIEKEQQTALEAIENNRTFSQSITNNATQSSAHDTGSEADMTTVVALSHFFVIQKWYATHEFLQFSGKLKSNNESVVVRVLKKQHQATGKDNFRVLHEREAAYYKNVSSLLEESFGWYYMCPFLEGELLETHIKRIGINQKYSLNELTSSDLELILAIWKEVQSLPFSCPLGKENFLVHTRRRLNLSKIIEVKIIGINTQTIDADESEKRINAMLEALLGQSLYHELHYHIQNQHP